MAGSPFRLGPFASRSTSRRRTAKVMPRARTRVTWKRRAGSCPTAMTARAPSMPRRHCRCPSCAVITSPLTCTAPGRTDQAKRYSTCTAGDWVLIRYRRRGVQRNACAATIHSAHTAATANAKARAARGHSARTSARLPIARTPPDEMWTPAHHRKREARGRAPALRQSNSPASRATICCSSMRRPAADFSKASNSSSMRRRSATPSAWSDMGKRTWFSFSMCAPRSNT